MQEKAFGEILPVVLFTVLNEKDSVFKLITEIISQLWPSQGKAVPNCFPQYFSLKVSPALLKVVLSFDSVDETLWPFRL